MNPVMICTQGVQNNMEEFLPNFDLVITRAGASSLNEISSLGIPSIIIPSPYVPNNHQFINGVIQRV